MAEERLRPDPDELLGSIKKAARGKLTVFLGAVAGVGKTYKMLEAAHERKADGVRVLTGWIETHGRPETERLAAGIPRIPPRELVYRDRVMQEMDIDAVLLQQPELVLVDELAHTNIPGSRHVRRYQDVEELLAAGIHVYTTVNIQHMESLNDVVAQITGVIVRETVPDYVLAQADNIQLIDIPPEELIKRLQEGKVYRQGQVQQALKNFFRLGNINALRELALRFTASRVDQDLNEYMRQKQIAGPWPAAGRIMVCVSPSPFSAQLIRAAHRFASGLHAEFLAVHIETAQRRFPLGDKERDRIARNMRLAEELGARTLMVVGNDLVKEILEVARTHNVTAIVVGKSGNTHLQDLFRKSFVDRLIRASGGIHVYVIQGTVEEEKRPEIKTVIPTTSFAGMMPFAGGLAMTALVTLAGWLGRDHWELVNVALLYLLPVLLSAVWWGRWPSYFTAVISVSCFDYLFVPPLFTFSVYDFRFVWSFAIFLLVSFLIGGRTEWLRREAKAAQLRERGIRALYKFSREIAAVIDLEFICRELVRHAGETIGRDTLVLCPDKSGKLYLAGSYDSSRFALVEDFSLSDAEYAVAVWSYKNRRVAGCSTETLPGAENLYVPLTAGENVGGVFGVRIGTQPVTPEEKRLIDAWSGLAAMAIERVTLARQAQQAALVVESDRLRMALFNSVSHELRTPLATITGAVSTLLDPDIQYPEELRTELLETILYGAARMERVVNNLLDTARQESGMLQLKTDWCDIEDMVGSAWRRISERKQTHTLITKLPETLPLLRADCVLLEQVLINLLDNAIKYSPQGSPITVSAAQDGSQVVLSVRDEGPGIGKEDRERIFEKFYRAPQVRKVSGTGLGLSICKGIVEAHKGVIWAENHPDGGAQISIRLPVSSDGTNP